MGIQSQLIKGLVALTAIMVLAAVFFPVHASNGHRSGSQSACLSRVKQISIGHLIYASDHDERLTFASSWEDGLDPYLKQELFCPEAPGKRYGYAMIDALSAANLKKIPLPDKVPLMIESIACIPNAHGDMDLAPKPGRHKERNVVGYADGHVKTVSVPR